MHRVPVLALLSVHCLAQSVDPTTLNDKVLLGYQGWFRCPGGGTSGNNWSHWSNGVPTAASLVIDMYPDLREFETGEGCAVPGMTIGPNAAYLFSAGNSTTVARHFRWMQEYALDGVLVQRFITDIPGHRAAGDAVLKNIMAAARRYGRVFAMEYDISGANPATLESVLQSDWQYLTGTLNVTSQPGYLHHNGKPVLAVWGMGLNDSSHPPSNPDAALQIVRWFQTQANVTYLGGTPAYWRTLSNDAAPDARWAGVYQAMDGIQPWNVGRYATLADVDRWKTQRIEPDVALTSQRQQIYMPVIFPGFSWYNLNRNARQNQIPRNGGQFLWRQAVNAQNAGARVLKIAMFDEVNESTAMFKVAARREDAPDQGYWLTLDADGFTLPSDWYLRLSGEITRAFRGQSKIAAELPSTAGPPWRGEDGAFALSAVNGANLTPGPLAPESIASISGATDAELMVIDGTGLARVATLLDSSSSPWRFLIPTGIASGPAALVQTGSANHGSITIAPVAPGLKNTGTLRLDGSEVATAVTFCAEQSTCDATPIDLSAGGAVLELSGTGIRGRTSLDAVTCTIGDVSTPVIYAGPHDSEPGSDVVKLTLPATLAGSGIVPLRLLVHGIASNPMLINIK
ncbi:MAG: hypothetical protein HYZ37_17410 [Candidatus Solibacter usitatus]|nr:hypothetical protein [Candidatus Solibacter usitatus]